MDEVKAAPAANTKRRVGIVVGLLIASAIGVYYRYSQTFEDTDDAQIDGDISAISARVPGTIAAVKVRENQTVALGELLAEIDPTDLEVTLAQAKATVAQAEALLAAEDPSVSMTETSNIAVLATSASDVATAKAALSSAEHSLEQMRAQLAQAEATSKLAALDRDRSTKLLTTGAVSRAELDQRNSAADASAANVDAMRQAIQVGERKVEEARARLDSSGSRLNEVKLNAPRQLETRRATVMMRKANLELAQAQLRQAELNLGYAKITSPAAGIVGKKSVHIGDRVQPGQQLMAVTQVDALWITANFRETQLRRMAPGQKAKIHVDALDLELIGEVESLAGATGSRYSLLPPENATGNYVKVVQRLPVRIKINPGQPGAERLRPGMSVEPMVSLE